MSLLEGIFHSQSPNDSKTVEFKDIIVETRSVEKELKNVAKKYGLSLKELDFTLISYKTYYKRAKIDKKFRLLKELEINDILIEENLLDNDFQLIQMYKINIFKKQSNALFPIKIVLGANKEFSTKSGGGLIKVTANGTGEIIDITIDDSLLEDKDSLQILLISATNDVLKMVEEDKKLSASKMMGGFGGMPGFSS